MGMGTVLTVLCKEFCHPVLGDVECIEPRGCSRGRGDCFQEQVVVSRVNAATGPDAQTGSAVAFAEIGGQMVEILQKGGSHKYLGRMFSGSLESRSQRNLDHRTSCAWLKFHEQRATLVNKHIPIHLRLKLFVSVVTPSALYSLSSTPLTATQLGKLGATQRRMIRKMIGWRRVAEEDWAETGHRMKERLAASMARCPVQACSVTRNHQRQRLMTRLDTGIAPQLTILSQEWVPPTTRPRARPRQRWTD